MTDNDPINPDVVITNALLLFERLVLAFEHIAGSLGGLGQTIGQAQFVETDELPPDPLRTLDDQPRTIVPPRVL